MNPWRGLAGLPRTSFLLAIATFVNRAGVMVRPMLVLYLTKHLGFAESLAGWMLALYGATTLIAAPLSGWLSDRFGAARVLRTALLLAAAAISCYPLASTPVQIAAATFLFALCNELPRPALMTLVADVAPPELRKQAFVLSRVAVNLGLSIGPALGGLIAGWSYLAIFWVDAAASLFAALILLRTPLPAHAKVERPAGSALAALAGDRLLLCFFVATVLNALVFFQHDSTMAYWMTHSLGLSEFDFGLTITVNTLLIGLVEVELNTRCAHWSHRRSLVVGTILTALGFGAMAFASDWWTVAGTVVIWTFGEMIAMPAMSAFVSDLAPPGRRGVYMSTLLLAFGGGCTFGPKLGLALLHSHGAVALWGATAAVGLAAAASYALLRPRRSTIAEAAPTAS